MGIYVFEAKFLYDQLRRDAEDPNSSHDFGNDIIPHIVKHGRAVAHHFSRSCVRSANEQEAYWRDVGTVDAYWAANIDLTDFTPQLDLYDRDWPIWTYGEITPPAKFVHDQVGRRGQALSSLVSGGCIVSGATLRRTLLFTGVRVNSYASVENAVILHMWTWDARRGSPTSSSTGAFRFLKGLSLEKTPSLTRRDSGAPIRGSVSSHSR